MTRVSVRPPLLALSLTGLLVALPSVARADVDLQVLPSQVPGLTCVYITYDCLEPQAVQLSIDSAVVIDHVAGGDILSAPRAPCFEESDLGAGAHTFSVEATCGGIDTDDSATASFSNPPVRLLGVEHTRFEWSTGDTVVFTLHAQDEDLDIEVDFSAVDSDYTPGSEVVVDLGGGDYEVRYELTSTSTAPAGEYRLPVSIASSSTVVRTYREGVTIRYAPVRTGAVTFQDEAGGTFHLADLPTGTYATISPLSTTFTVDAVPGAKAMVTGAIHSAASLEGSFVIVNVHQADTGGHASLDVEITESECVAGSGCTSQIELPLVLRPARLDEFEDDDDLELELSLGVYTPNGPTFTPSFGLSELWFVDKQPANALSMKGALTYERVRYTDPVPFNDSRPPQFGQFMRYSEKSPLRRVTIEIKDNCHGTLQAVTQEDGSWHMYVPDDDGCLVYGPHTMRASAHSSFGVYRVAAQRLADLAPFPADTSELYALGSNNFVTQKDLPTTHVDAWPYEDHDWGAKHFDVNDDFYSWFASLQVGVRVQQYARPFLIGHANLDAFPWLYMRVVPGRACDNTSCYLASRTGVYVSEIAGNTDAQDEFVLCHEAFYWFQHMFMPALHGNGSGGTHPWAAAFGEGLANVMATLVTGQPWLFIVDDLSTQAENPDIQGNNKVAPSVFSTFNALPVDLYVETTDHGSGGWSWRILWDLLDGSQAEPHGVFARYLDGTGDLGPAPITTDYGTNFDTIGGLDKFQDVVVRYLGGNYMPANPARPDLDDRGQDGVDMTEFLDGVLCRGHEDWNDMEMIIGGMMNFIAYDSASAPLSCP